MSKKEYPSLLETEAGEAAIKGGLIIFMMCFVAGIVAPIFIPWAFRVCKNSMPEGLSPAAYETELHSRKTFAVMVILVIWVIAILFLVWSYATQGQ